MAVAGPAIAGSVLDRRRWWSRKSHQPERRSATDPLRSTNHASGTVYWRQFAIHHCQLLSVLIDSRFISSFKRCSVCDSERRPVKCS